MKYTRMFSYLICFAFAIFILVFMAKQATLIAKRANSTVEIHVERAYDKDIAQYGYKMITILPEKETKP